MSPTASVVHSIVAPAAEHGSISASIYRARVASAAGRNAEMPFHSPLSALPARVWVLSGCPLVRQVEFDQPAGQHDQGERGLRGVEPSGSGSRQRDG